MYPRQCWSDAAVQYLSAQPNSVGKKKMHMFFLAVISWSVPFYFLLFVATCFPRDCGHANDDDE